MSKITNSDLAKVLIEKHGLGKADAERFVTLMFSILNDGLRQDKLVKIKGLGTFKVISVSSRKSVDVNTGKPIIIEGRDKISFTPDNALRDKVNAPFAQFDTVVINDGVDFSTIDQAFEDEKGSLQSFEGTAVEPLTEENEIQDTASKEQPEDRTTSKENDTTAESIIEQAQDVESSPAEETVEKITLSEESVGGAAEKEQPTITEAATVSSEKESDPAPIVTKPVTRDALSQETSAIGVQPKDNTDSITEEKAIIAETKEDNNKFRHRVMVWTIVAASVIVLLLGGSIYYFLNELQIRDNRISHLEAMVDNAENRIAKSSSIKNTANATDAPMAQSKEKSSAKTQNSSSAIERTKEKTVTEKISNSSVNTEDLKSKSKENENSKASIPTSTKEPAKSDISDYNKDIRIRTGAYNIVGIDRTVIVKEGQSLASISRTYLGPGMECYVEAVNQGKTDYKPGDGISIPKVKLKKRNK